MVVGCGWVVGVMAVERFTSVPLLGDGLKVGRKGGMEPENRAPKREKGDANRRSGPPRPTERGGLPS